MFVIKAYYRKEISLLYFPNHSTRAASKCFRQWLENREGAEDLLKRIGGKRVLTKQDIVEVVEILGEP